MNGYPSNAGDLVIRELQIAGAWIQVLVDPVDAAPDEPVLGPSIGEYPVYDAALYQTMNDDLARNERFHNALSALCPGKRVLDVGTGADLNWALDSLRCAAAHVDAVEVIEKSYLAARGKLADLAMADRVTLHHGSSSELSLPQRAEVCVGEVVGSVAGAEGAAAVMSDVRQRLLSADGAIVPHRAVTLAAGVALREVLGDRPVAFSAASMPYLSAIFAATGGPRDVRLRVKNPVPGALVTGSADVEVLDFNGELATEQEHHAVLQVNRAGFLDGILTWLQLWCTPDERPLDALATRTNWASVYFPLFDGEIPVSPGDQLEVRFRTELSDDGIHPDYQVAATLRASGQQHRGTHISRHHGPAFRGDAIFRRLFPQR